FGLDPLRDVQVLTPLHGGPLGTVALNELLREALNPPAPGRPELSRFGRLFRLGDKVMQVRNNYDLAVFNGDIGVITALDPEEGSLTIDFEGRSVEYGLDALDQLEPAFAITCHKSQGSEFPAVVLPIVGAHSMMLRRNLVYTAFTRARRVLCAVGQWRALHAAVAAAGSGQRHSRLAERLRGEA
ncbi:MAG TPA: ATP-binding domain-containing protein, partial [Planctomycetota bacterium]|nr:ATP-binding domain-containing protein [Planctomycetota bacterium]